ncbi:hypothetical protein B835_2886 [Enterococcus mundtii 3F]|uniref:hypothetical protein n=1 Tax=Enterococcus mundtii TaxID=53346 RepID=UPI0023025CB5|nr:hypothetical protein [Enterococcus mundtii]MDA9462923.1 hypothetical protein [Enterococcus mundtii 3F]
MDTDKVYILLFGLDDQRNLFYQDVISRKVKLKRFPSLTEPNSSAYVIDCYNKGLHELIVSKLLEKKLETVEELQELEKEWPNLLAEEYKHLPHWKRYWLCMQWNPKNRLLNIFKKVVTERRLFTEKGALYYRNKYKYEKNFNKHIERGCKNGLDIAIHCPNVRIYFVLDKLNMHNISKKNCYGQYESDYTCKELRYIFRHWNELKEKVVFFENKKIVKAPWIRGKYVKAWQKYSDIRKRRFTWNLNKQECKSMENIQSSTSLTSEKAREHKNLQSLLIEAIGKQNNIQELKKPPVHRQRALTI